MKVKRKWIAGALAALGGVAAVLRDQLGVALDYETILYAIVPAVIYVAGEWVNDLNKVKEQLEKWKDPMFWTAIGGSVFPVLFELLQVDVSQEGVTALVALIMTLVFGKRYKGLKQK